MTRSCDWRQNAACARDPHVNSLDPWYSDDPDIERLAVAICRVCSVKVLCLREGLLDSHGVWGGWRPDERRRLRERLERCTTTQARAAIIEQAAMTGPGPLGMENPPRRR